MKFNINIPDMKFWNSLFILLFPVVMMSQKSLTMNEAISIALEENYGIQIAMLEQIADEMQVYKSNAGGGFTLNWNANFTITANNANQKFLDGRELRRWGRGYFPNTNLSAALPLYDGGKIQAIYDRLGLVSQFSRLESKVMIQNTVSDVMQAYFTIERHKQTVDFLTTILKHYEERLNITEERWKVGSGSKLDYLQSKTVMNAQLSELSVAKNNLKNSKVTLNGLLNRDANVLFETEQVDSEYPDFDLQQLEELVQNQNQELLLMNKSIEISRKREEELEADRKPQIGLNGSLGYSYSNSNTGFLTSNSNIFGNIGLGAVWNLYDGHHRKNQIAISKINTEIVELQKENLKQQLINDLTFAFNQYNQDKELLSFEELNRTIAEENLSISLQKFRLGGSSILELNEAQRVYDTALNRLVNAQYNIKISELELLRLSGTLIGE